MNKTKYISISITLVVIALVTLLVIWQPAAAKDRLKWYPLQAGKTIELGKQGISVTNIPHGVSAVLAGPAEKPLPKRFSHRFEISYRAPVMEVHFLNPNGGTIERINAEVYFFFNIGKSERKLWDQGGANEIAIWYYNERDGRWQICPTFFVNENLDNGTFDRLACVAPGSGYYALGGIDFFEISFNPYTIDNQKVVDAARKYHIQ
jgi:hypothetical protein